MGTCLERFCSSMARVCLDGMKKGREYAQPSEDFMRVCDAAAVAPF